MLRRAVAVAVALSALVALPVPDAPASAAPCEAMDFDGSPFTVCRFDLRDYELRLFWQDADGRPYAAFRNLPAEIDGAPLVFAMNAGMYHADLSPVGLYVEDGEELSPISTRDGPGNFHLMPNGVFYVTGNEAGVRTTQAFGAASIDVDYATQSGPMLVIDGDLHPRFLPHSDSLRIRNGVGVTDPHTVVFAISEEPVNFDRFGRLFRDGLDTPNALYLDGTMSSLFAPALNRADARRPMGPIVGVLGPAE